jgi:hypothetical protein
LRAVKKGATNVFRKIHPRIRVARNRLAPAISDASPIVLDQEVIPLLVQCARGPEKFQDCMAPDNHCNSSHRSPQSFHSEFFRFTHKLEQDDSIVSAVRKRFCYLIYYRSKLLWQNKGWSEDVVYVLSHLVKRSYSCELELAEIHRILRGWVERGERYDLLSKDLGSLGALFLLPADKESL